MSETLVNDERRNRFSQRRTMRQTEAVAGEHPEERRSKPAVDVSVIIPVSERYDNVREVYNAYKADLDRTSYAYEIIYVLDGAYADVLAELRQLLSEGEPLKIIRFTRAFGESTALTAGFANSDGPILVTLPAYHQVEPGSVARLLNALADNDMVVGRRWPRTDSGFNRFQTRLFYRVQKMITGHELHDLGCGVRGFKRQVADEVSIYGDQHRFLPIIAQRWGFKVKELDLPQSPKDAYRRVYRPGVYLRRLLDLLTVFFLSKFTKKPLRFFGLIGSGIAFIGAIILVWLTIERLFLSVALADRPALLAGSLLVVVGIQIFGLGLLAELIIFTHAKDLKEYTVEEVIN
ncbi:glycosyltransferase [Salinisphaera sp.]|uniref:glycosyltransferase n=1 Tax=Salinisphaera sp. TaxID=1914330 RepID=UPI002D78049D|nr:glycosyltransferase [Salinisphaera sp.]HET7313357.1 glycosyltransferase [Salinisphaera sp.]